MDLTTRVQTILNDHPDLHIWGNGSPGRGKPNFEIPAAREELLRPTTLQDIQAAADWCALHLVPTRRNLTRDGTTYYWKHVYEHHTGGQYLPSGAFAVAAVLANMPIYWDNYNPVIHARESRHHPIEGRRG